MTSTWRVEHHANGPSLTDEIRADRADIDAENNLVLTDSLGTKAIYKRDAWFSAVREKPEMTTVIVVPLVVGTAYIRPPFIERHAELII